MCVPKMYQRFPIEFLTDHFYKLNSIQYVMYTHILKFLQKIIDKLIQDQSQIVPYLSCCLRTNYAHWPFVTEKNAYDA
jgi:hypothetical protein